MWRFLFAERLVFSNLLERLLKDVTGFLSDSSGRTEVAELGGVVLGEEDVETLYVAVDDVFAVQVMHAQAQLDEHLPDKVLDQILAVLLPNVSVQVSMLAELLNDVYRRPVNERVVVANHIVRVQLAQYLDFLQGFERSFFRQKSGVDFFDNIVLIDHQRPDFVLFLDCGLHVASKHVLVQLAPHAHGRRIEYDPDTLTAAEHH